MPRTRQDLIVKALSELGIVQVGQDPSAEDTQKVDDIIDGKVDELANRRVFYVQDIEAIEDRFFLPLAKIMANAIAPDFGTPYDPAVDVREEARLKDIDRRPPSYAVVTSPFI